MSDGISDGYDYNEGRPLMSGRHEGVRREAINTVPDEDVVAYVLIALRALRDNRIYFAQSATDKAAHTEDYDAAVKWVYRLTKENTNGH